MRSEQCEELAGLIADLRTHINNIYFDLDRIADFIGDLSGSERQKSFSEKLRENAIDDLLKKEGYTW